MDIENPAAVFSFSETMKSIRELKQIQQKITDGCGLTSDQSAQIVGYYNGKPELDTIAGGDFSPVASACNVLGFTPSKTPDSTTEKPTKTPRKPKENQITRIQDAQKIPVIDGEVINNELPADYSDTIETWLKEWAQDNGIELDKCAGLQWRAACLYIGHKIQQSGILRDKEREAHHGGKIYNPQRLESLLYIWEYITNKYRHVPLTVDFVAFTGVSRQYFYDYDRGGLTSSAVQIVKKARAIEEAGLSVGLNDGRENPTGRIYYSKARLGWRETTEIIHTTAKETEAAAVLPVFDGVSGLIEG